MNGSVTHYGNGTAVRFECPGSVTKDVYVGGILTTPASEDFESVTLASAPAVGVTVQIDWDDGIVDEAPLIIEALDDLTDVALATPSAGQYLRYTAGKWVNQTLDLSAYALNSALADYALVTSLANYLPVNGTAAAATKLATPRNINGVAFDGTADITITASGSDPTKLPLTGGSLSGNLGAGTTNIYNYISLPNGGYVGWNSAAGTNDDVGVKGTNGVFSVYAQAADRLTVSATETVVKDTLTVTAADGSPWGLRLHRQDTGTSANLYNDGTGFYSSVPFRLPGGEVLPTSVTFNNMGRDHGATTDFNLVPSFGPHYVQGGGNAPVSGQFYGFTLGLGNQYGLDQYASQFYWPRTPLGQPPYLWLRFKESGSWGSWSKINAGYADSAGSLTVNAGTDGGLDGYTTSAVYTISYTGFSRTMLAFGGSGSTGTVQLEADYQGILRWRNKTDMANWTGWRTLAVQGGVLNGSYIVSGYDPGAGAGSISCSNWFRPASGTGMYWASHNTGVMSPSNVSYGCVQTYSSYNGYAGYAVNSARQFILMGHVSDAAAKGIYDESAGQWMTIWDGSNNATFPANITAYSDRRLKKDIEPIRDALSKLLAITGVTFTRTDDDTRGIGVIAQDVQQVFPEAVVESKPKLDSDDTVLTVAYGNLVGPIIEALRDIDARLRVLEGRGE